jgi:hypothetical protein
MKATTLRHDPGQGIWLDSVPDDVVRGGKNAKKPTRVPAACRVGDNAWAFLGGFRLREKKAEKS